MVPAKVLLENALENATVKSPAPLSVNPEQLKLSTSADDDDLDHAFAKPC
jgi:hypothetical protein